MSQQENQNSIGFRPIRRGQVIEGAEEEPTQVSQTSNPSFTRRKTEQNAQPSIFPSWDLLPPKTIIRRKG